MKKRSRPASRSTPLATPIAVTVSAQRRARRGSRAPPSSGPGRRRSGSRPARPGSPAGRRRLVRRVGRNAGTPGMPCSLTSREKRRCITSRIMPKSSPGVISVERMLNLRYWFFTKPSGPATIIAPTGVGAHDVRVVVDLDPARHAGRGRRSRQSRRAAAPGSRFRPAGGRAPRGRSAGRGRSGPSSRRAAAR